MLDCFPVSPWLMSRGAGETIPQHLKHHMQITDTFLHGMTLFGSFLILWTFVHSYFDL
jgi:hypothetical protein